MTAAPRPTYVVIACPRCGHVLASSDGRRLTLGGAYLTRPVTLRCAVCEHKRLWLPDRAIDKNNHHVPP